MKNPFAALIIAVVLACVVAAHTPAAPPASDARIAAHLLNRLGFGPRPGDIARVERIGTTAFIDEQLHPERIDDRAIEKRLAPLTTLTMTTKEIVERYAIPLRERRRQQKAGDNKPVEPRSDVGLQDLAQRQARMPLVELAQQKLLRAIYSERQLQEVLVDFWFNHFNVDARKGPVRFMLTEYERAAIRPHVLGRFRDLLGATAESPAMLFYLDNWISANRAAGDRLARKRAAGNGVPDRRPAPDAAQPERRPRGLNENYGRELLELHTLGVDGGYTQEDVTDIARAFTGWTIERPRQRGGFRFVPALHDDGAKVVLGTRIDPGGGRRDGEHVLDMLAEHPATARHIASALAQRFVSHTPPPGLVDRVAREFLSTHGDLRAVTRTVLTSPEFLAAASTERKVKTPLDFIVSMVRVTGADVRDGRGLVRAVQELGMPLYQCQPPTGYSDSADTWMNTGALVSRMNIALSIANGSTPGVRLPSVLDPRALLEPYLTESTAATIARAATAAEAIALALGSPEFQRK